jgi:adenylyltransferase/sulfurtransferase
MNRYQRQIDLIGEDGQARLEGSHALVVGAGGLGSPVALYLAGAGLSVSLVDFDRVSLTNLHRQILYGTGDLAQSKCLAAMERLSELNPDIQVTALNVRLDENTAPGILHPYDVVLDCTDTYRTRYVVSDLCHQAQKPCVYGAVRGWCGEVALFRPEGPCYRCLHPAKPLGESGPPGGIVGPTTGVIGSLMAYRALKLLLGDDHPSLDVMSADGSFMRASIPCCCEEHSDG